MLFGRKRYNYFQMILLYFKITPLIASVKIIQRLIGSVIPAFNIIVTAQFIDGAVKVVGNKGSDFSPVIFPVSAIVGIMLWNHFIGAIMSLLDKRTEIKRRRIFEPAIVEKKARLKFKYYENQETTDVINRSADSFTGNTQNFFNEAFGVWDIIAQLIGFLAVLGSRLWWAAIVFLVLSVPSFIISYRFGKKRYDVGKEMTKIDRKTEYLFNILTGRDTIEERFTYGYTEKLNGEYKKAYEISRKANAKVNRAMWVNMKFAGLLVFISGIVVIALMIPSVITPDAVTGEAAISIGLFTSLVTGIWSLQQVLQWQVGSVINNVRHQFEYLKDLNKFLEYEEDEDAVCLPDKESVRIDTIEFRSVSFRYPDCEPFILKDFSLTMKAGKHYAIVGTNGAGKTTLTKLLTGLYTNYEGEIFVNGKELRTYTQSQLKAMSAVVYQDFSRFNLDFHGNIAIGNINNYDDTVPVERAADIMELGEVVDKLSDKYKTPLTKIKENGVDLSGGEWQRVALARLIVSPSPLKILDEPTAALDPKAESRVYEKFSDIVNHQKESKEGITIFISHRLGSTRLADEIIVIADGKNAEQGAFSELIAKRGIYAEMFESQAAWYRDDAAAETEGVSVNV
ncbi:ABC transporter ATP-binding protein [Clostridia bacterium]|nr:ABC transporter ATP-binding protein [Clostridia bacterium]